MKTPAPLLIRADAGGRIGTGHVMRMIALAQAWQDRGGDVTIACVSLPEGVAARLEAAGIVHRQLVPCEPGGELDREQTIALASELGCDWVVLDGYQFGVEFQSAVRATECEVMAVDDYGHCERWASDALLNQNLGVERNPRESEVEPFKQLLGSRFALLRREFYERSWSASRSADLPIRKLLVTLGGVDPDDATGTILALLELAQTEPLEIRVLAGAANPNLEKLRSVESRHKIEVLVNVSDMPGQYEWADGIISAGGSTCWEWLFYNLPACVVTVADNQVPVVEELSRKGFAVSLGWDHELADTDCGTAIGKWMESGVPTQPGCGREGPVDGWGAHRVAAYLADCPVLLREARADDMMTYFHWANDPGVRANAFHPEPISLEDHKRWFARRLDSEEAKLLLGETLQGEPIGQVRFELLDDGKWLLGFSVGKEFRGRRLGVPLLREALRICERGLPGTEFEVHAEVKPDNPASLKTLKRSGFRSMGDDKLNERGAIELTFCGSSASLPKKDVQ